MLPSRRLPYSLRLPRSILAPSSPATSITSLLLLVSDYRYYSLINRWFPVLKIQFPSKRAEPAVSAYICIFYRLQKFGFAGAELPSDVAGWVINSFKFSFIRRIKGNIDCTHSYGNGYGAGPLATYEFRAGSGWALFFNLSLISSDYKQLILTKIDKWRINIFWSSNLGSKIGLILCMYYFDCPKTSDDSLAFSLAHMFFWLTRNMVWQHDIPVENLSFANRQTYAIYIYI